MPTAITTKGLLQKCRRFILTDPSREGLDELIKDAIITSCREISDLSSVPMAWNREIYDEIFTRYYAEISAITAANPGVITADSVDPDLSDDHGFQTNDIVFIDGVNGEYSRHRLNNRLFRAVRASATTITLKTLDGQTAINTTDYEAYDSGGKIYHAGIVLPHASIEPGSSWTINRVFDVNFDCHPCHPISDNRAVEHGYDQPGSRPKRWRYQQYTYSTFTTTNIEHLLFWYPYVSQRYNVKVHIEKEYPDISTWNASTYPPHPIHIHDFIWHRALANISTYGDANRRRSAGKKGEEGDNTKIEVLNAQYWISKAAGDESKILDYSRKLEGNQSYISQGTGA